MKSKEPLQKGWKFCPFFGPQFWNQILCQDITHDETLITEKFYLNIRLVSKI